MNFTIRSAEEKDRQHVYRFICQLEESNFDYTLFQSIYEENTINRNCIYLVAEPGDGNIIGFISCHIQNLLHHCGKVAEIAELFVDEKYRSLGIGNALIKEMEKRLLAEGCISFEVTARNKRIATHRFYEGQGFEATHKKFVKQLPLS